MKIAQELYEGIDVGGDGPVGPDHLHAHRQPPRLRRGDAGRPRPDPGQHGERYLPAKPPRYQAGKLAQEAHEAIRPTDLALSPDALKGRLTVDQLKLYGLIYRRFVASQMTPAVFAVTDVEVTAGAGSSRRRARS
jgi:DNA topoisomerase-1